jgi:hypothetical protein
MDLTIRFIWNDTKEEVTSTIVDCESSEKCAEKWFKHWQLATNSSTEEELLKQITVLDIRPAHLIEVMSDYCIY